MLRNKRGSAILWGFLTSAFLIIIIFAVLSLAFSFHRRSLNSSRERQAYYTARSAAEIISKQIANGNASLLPLNVSDEVSVSDVVFSEQMGDCSAVVKRTTIDTIMVTATATYGGQTVDVSGKLTQKYREVTENGGVTFASPNDLSPVQTVVGDVFIDMSSAPNNVIMLKSRVEGNLYTNGIIRFEGGSVTGELIAKQIQGENNSIYLTSQTVKKITVEQQPNFTLDSAIELNVVPGVTSQYIKVPYISSFETYIPAGSPDNYVPEASAKIGTGQNSMSTLTLTSGNYVLDINLLSATRLILSGDGTINLYIPKNCQFSFSQFEIASGSPTFNVFVNSNGKLGLGNSLGNHEVTLNVYGVGTQSKVLVSGNVRLKGQVYLADIEGNQDCLVIDGTGIQGASKHKYYTVPDGWVIAKYLVG